MCCPRCNHRFGIAGEMGITDLSAVFDIGIGKLECGRQAGRRGIESRAQEAHVCQAGSATDGTSCKRSSSLAGT